MKNDAGILGHLVQCAVLLYCLRIHKHKVTFLQRLSVTTPRTWTRCLTMLCRRRGWQGSPGAGLLLAAGHLLVEKKDVQLR
jgi:hypothetical protein